MSNKSKELYWCDRCFKDYVGDEEEIKRTYFGCATNQQWAKHLTTNKHIKNVKKVEDSSDCILCKFCNKNFSNEGYEIHKKRNTKLWTMQKAGAYKHLKCNNFKTKNRRYESFNEYCIDIDPNKPKTRRMRGRNDPKPKSKHYSLSASSNSDLPSSSESESESDTEEEAEEQPTQEQPVLDTKTIKDKMTKQIIQKDSKGKEVWKGGCPKMIANPNYDPNFIPPSRIKDGLHLTIEEIDDGGKPQFEDYCVSCYKPINYEEDNISDKMLLRWDIITCSCPDSDCE
tara:strand:- start:1577 stop:2431 length:855 start_codon:yes stop_codon:yes gene_type:complete